MGARILVLFGLGALVGTLADQIHVRSGVLSYARPAALLLGQAAWVPLLFGAAGVVLCLGNGLLLRLAPGRPARASGLGLLTAMLWFLAAYASTAAFQETPLRLTLALVVLWLVRVARSPATDEVIAGPLFAVAGSMFEGALASTGAFEYRHPDLLLVPAWLPALYLHASLLTREAYLVVFARER